MLRRNALQEMHTRHWGTIPAYNSTATRQRGGVKYVWVRMRTRRITWVGGIED